MEFSKYMYTYVMMIYVFLMCCQDIDLFEEVE